MTKAYVLRTCNADMTAHGGFAWPASGPVECPDWNPRPKCGNGLHGLLDGNGDYSLLSSDVDAKWLVVEVEREDCIDIDGKVKFPRGNVVYTGCMAGAMTMISNWWIKRALAETPDGERIQSASGADSHLAASGADSHLAASGYRSHLAASGYRSHLAASGADSRLAASGADSHLAASGYRSHLAASGADSRLAASGADSRLAASGYRSRLAASGYRSHLAASGEKSLVMGAYGSVASAAEGGAIALAWWDQEAGRPRIAVAYVGENGIKPNVLYRLDEHGQFVEA